METLINIGSLGYLLMFFALAVKDILFLRALLTIAHITLVSFGISSGNTNIAFWNTIFILINSIQIFFIIRDRYPVKMTPDIAALYQQTFSIMTQKEFFRFWHKGKTIEAAENDTIIKKNKSRSWSS